LTCLKLCTHKAIWVSPKMMVLPAGTLPETLTISLRQVDGVIRKIRRRSSLWITPTTFERVVVGCTSLSFVGRLQPPNPITAIYSGFLVQLVPTLLCSSWQTLSARKVVRASVGLQLVLLRTVYSQARGCVCAALQLGGDVEQSWLMSKYDVVHKTGSI